MKDQAIESLVTHASNHQMRSTKHAPSPENVSNSAQEKSINFLNKPWLNVKKKLTNGSMQFGGANFFFIFAFALGCFRFWSFFGEASYGA